MSLEEIQANEEVKAIISLNAGLPIDKSDISDFDTWVNWSGWKGYDKNHKAFDFACYLNKRRECILGLPPATPVRAIADGVVRLISPGEAYYSSYMIVTHPNNIESLYCHVVPSLRVGEEVLRGQKIANLFHDTCMGKVKGRLVHLHLEILKGREINPEKIYPELEKMKAHPQGQKQFEINGLEGAQPKIKIANFESLLVNEPTYSEAFRGFYPQLS